MENKSSLIAAALVKAKRQFGPALKLKVNAGFKSKYADLAACLEAVDQPCLDAGIVLYQETFEDSSGVTVETVFLHESGESLRCGKLHVPASKQDPQGYGSALSYARRYSLMAACGIAAEDDDGQAASAAAAKARAQQRDQWLTSQLTAIANAASVGELKRIKDVALSTAEQERDQDAGNQILAACNAKAAKARPKPEHNPELERVVDEARHQ